MSRKCRRRLRLQQFPLRVRLPDRPQPRSEKSSRSRRGLFNRKYHHPRRQLLLHHLSLRLRLRWSPIPSRPRFLVNQEGSPALMRPTQARLMSMECRLEPRSKIRILVRSSPCREANWASPMTRWKKCFLCSRVAITRGRCKKHYDQWREDRKKKAAQNLGPPRS